MAATLKAGLSQQTLHSLAEAEQSRHSSDFLLVPEASDSSSTGASTARSLAESLPQVWQDLFDATRAAQSNDFLDGLACAPEEARAPHPSSTRGGGSSGAAADDPGLGINRDTAFTQFLSPQALIQHHRLGKPQVRRLYQALQVYSLGFHQMAVELTGHALDRGLLLLAIWRSFAMLWDGALQVVFPTETVQTSRERQAALLMSERLLETLQEEEARTAGLEQENAALRQQVERMGVQVLNAQADVAVARQGTAGLEQQLRAARQEAAAASARADAERMEVLRLQDKIAALGGPQEELYTRAQQLEALVREKQGQLSTAAKQAAQALDGKEEAKQAARVERLAREAAEQRVQQLQADLARAAQQAQELAAAASINAEQAVAEVSVWKRQAQEYSVAREDDTARAATERAGWQRAAAEAEAAASSLQKHLTAALQELAEEKGRSEQLVASLWPLAAKVKALEAAAAHKAQAGHGGPALPTAAAAAGQGAG